MTNSLLNPYAIDSNGKYVSVEHASKNQDYFCPICHQPFSYCERGKGKHSRREHFKHKVKTTCSGPSESYIHSYAKHEIFKILQRHIDEHREFPISWTCTDCGSTFNGNLLKGAKSVEMEKQFKDKLDSGLFKKPDVSLVDENGNLIVAIEVVFKHDVENNTLQFFEHNDVVLVRICVQSAEECNDMEQRLKTPDSVNLCFNRDCKLCQTQTICRSFYWLWNKDRTAYVALVPGVFNPFGDDGAAFLPFLPQDEQLAKQLAAKYWPDRQCKMQQGKNFPYFAPVRQQSVVRTIVPTYSSRKSGPRIDYYEQKMDKKSHKSHSNKGKNTWKSKGRSSGKAGGKGRR